MVNVHIHWGSSLEESSPPMQNSSADNLPTLSSTSLTTDTTENACSGGHETPSLSNQVSGLQNRTTKRPVTSKVNDEAVRAAKQQIRSKLREDWSWPPTSSPPDALDSPDAIAEWRERDSDSSLASTPQDPNPNPYKYDSPDSLHQPVLSRKRKRRRRLKEEMEWNEGLRTYVERRDAWAGARTQPMTPPPTVKSPFEAPYPQVRPPPNGTSFTPPSPRTVVPVAPPIMSPDHPIRTTVQPATYPQIYSKIIIQGLAPTVPINLKDVVKSLVAGWKKDGEWPPKSDAEKAGLAHAATGEGMGMGMGMGIGAHPRKAVRRSVGKVKRVLGFGHSEDGGGEGEEGKPF